ncbi:MAG: D-alanine--D-alanine ligase [Planctomycetota bacterium]
MSICGADSAPGQLRILLLAGGTSAERDVSLESGHCVAETLRQRGHCVQILDPACTPLSAAADVDIILPMLHGTGAEDGTLQRELERQSIPWLGSSPAASALTFSKSATRQTLAMAGLPVAPGFSATAETHAALIRQNAERLGLPLVVKPSQQGSSIGITLVQSWSQFPEALQVAFQWGPEIVVERWVSGRELTVPVIDQELFPAIEILPERPWYDYEAKYQDQLTRYQTAPAGLPDDLLPTVLRAVNVCGVSAISRTDLRLAPDGTFCILEINTIPGMTSHSLVPLSIAAAGRELGELLEMLLWRRLQTQTTKAAA